MALETGGAEGTRTHDILLAKQALYQLSYGPFMWHNMPIPCSLGAGQCNAARLAWPARRRGACSL